MSPGRELPLRHRSYGLMRQAKSLPPASVPSADRSLQVVASPCWEMALPDVISASLSLDAWTCTPSAREGALTRFFPSRHRPSPPRTQVGAERIRSATSERPSITGRQSFANVQASKFACHPDRCHRCGSRAHRAAVAFTSERNAGRYLPAHRIC